jgi:predicted Zn-dependent protease
MINLLDLKNSDQAINYLQKVAEVNPRNQVVMSELVSLYEEENKLDEGLAFLTDVHNKDPQNTPDIAYGIGEILTMSGRDAEAVTFLERATTSPENGVRAFRELAEAYARGGDTEKALDSYSKALVAQEKDIQDKQAKGLPTTFAVERLNYTKLDMAREHLQAGETDKAQAILDEVSAVMPNDEGVTALQESIKRSKQAG